jgi:hypothetical protein
LVSLMYEKRTWSECTDLAFLSVLLLALHPARHDSVSASTLTTLATTLHNDLPSAHTGSHPNMIHRESGNPKILFLLSIWMQTERVSALKRGKEGIKVVRRTLISDLGGMVVDDVL